MQLKRILAWASYDLANTIFSALFVTFFFPFYIKNFLGGNELQIGIVFGSSMLLVAIIVPVLGSISDKLQRRMPFIIFFTIACCIFTFLVAFAGLYPALIFGFIANYCYHGALTMYNALLPKVSAKGKIGHASGIGVAMGYLGTIISLAIAYPVLQYFGWESLNGAKAMIATSGILFFAFSLVLFVSIKEKAALKTKQIKSAVSSSIRDFKNNFRKIRKQKGLFNYLLSLIFYNDAINAVVIFLFLFGREQIGLSVQNFFYVYAIFALLAAIASLISGRMVDSIGSKKVLLASGILWIIVVLLLIAVRNLAGFILIGSLGGIALGMFMTASRPKLIELVPEKNIAEYFGFFELADKFAGVSGPIVFGFLAFKYGYTAGILSLLVFFIVGIFFLKKVPDSNVKNTPV